MPRDQCKRLEKIASEFTDKAIELYDQGKIVEFLGAIESIALLNEVKDSTCEVGE